MGIKAGDGIKADEVMNSQGLQFKNFAQLLFNAKHIGYNSKLNVATGSPNLKNILYHVNDNDANTIYNFIWDNTNKYYYMPDMSSSNIFYVIIEATSISSTADFSINGCICVQLAANKWLLYCTAGANYEENRARVYKTLFYGTDGSNPRASSTYITNCTALKTCHADDVGKRGHYAQMTCYMAAVNYNNGDHSYIGVFANTTDNYNCQAWSYIYGYTGASSGSAYAYLPSDTTINSISISGSSATSDETQTNTSLEKRNNPADVKLRLVGSSNSNFTTSFTLRIFLVAKGGITWTLYPNWILGPTSGTTLSASSTDFYVNNSIPEFTMAGTLAEEGANSATLIWNATASSTITNSITTWNSSIAPNDTLTVSVSYDGGNTYTQVSDATIARATPTGTDLRVKFQVTRTSLSNQDKIGEHATCYNWY